MLKQAAILTAVAGAGLPMASSYLESNPSASQYLPKELQTVISSSSNFSGFGSDETTEVEKRYAPLDPDCVNTEQRRFEFLSSVCGGKHNERN